MFTWKMRINSRTEVGAEAGYISNTTHYRVVTLDKVQHSGHVLAWFYMTGEWPTDEVDHKNGVRHDNRWDNLRPVTHQANMQNAYRSITRSNASGFLGVRKHIRHGKVRYGAVIQHNYKSLYLGYYDTPEEASAIFVAKKRELHPNWIPQ